MPDITLPDGSTRRFDQPVTVQEVAREIGKSLARAMLAGEVDGQLVDDPVLRSVEGIEISDKAGSIT